MLTQNCLEPVSLPLSTLLSPGLASFSGGLPHVMPESASAAVGCKPVLYLPSNFRGGRTSLFGGSSKSPRAVLLGSVWLRAHP